MRLVFGEGVKGQSISAACGKFGLEGHGSKYKKLLII